MTRQYVESRFPPGTPHDPDQISPAQLAAALLGLIGGMLKYTSSDVLHLVVPATSASDPSPSIRRIITLGDFNQVFKRTLSARAGEK